jgi:hypothetical protein
MGADTEVADARDGEMGTMQHDVVRYRGATAKAELDEFRMGGAF